MNLKCRINNTDYDLLVQGNTLADEYNETLDSGTIVIDHTEEIPNLKPYDDVYIYSGEFNRFDKHRKFYTNIKVKQSKEEHFVTSNIFTISDKDGSGAIDSISQQISDAETQDLTFSTTISFFNAGRINSVIKVTYTDCYFEIFKIDDEKKIWYLRCDSGPTCEDTLNSGLTPEQMLSKLDIISGSKFKSDSLELQFYPNGNNTELLWDSENETKWNKDKGNWETSNTIFEYSNYYLINVTLLESNDSNFQNDLELTVQKQTYSHNFEFKTIDYLTIDATSNFEKASSETGSKISDTFNFVVNINKEGSPNRLQKITKIYECTLLKDNNGLLVLSGRKISEKLTGSDIQTENEQFDGNSISIKFEKIDNKYQKKIEKTQNSRNTKSYYTYEIDPIAYEIEQSTSGESMSFYKHLLVDTYHKERINVHKYSSDDKILYKYRIELFSEAKRLETIQLPNISVTQPIDYKNKKGKTIYYYINQFVSMYSPKIKMLVDEKSQTWDYVSKYYLDPKLKAKFDNVFSPNFSLNNPNLRDVLKNLFLVKDCIPIVKDDMISYLDITERKGIFDATGVTKIIASQNSENYCDSLKRTYSNALSQENTCKSIEFLNFRNSNDSLMTLDNMRLETRFPIYKINKIYMCYFKKNTVKTINSEQSTTQNFLCQQDITPLVKLNSERQLLKKDWNEFENDFIPLNIEELAQYRMATIGYDIGSKYITGWGEKYSYIKDNITWFKYDKTYLQNILTIVDTINPFGTKEYFISDSDDEVVYPGEINFDESNEFIDIFDNKRDSSDFIHVFSNNALGLKGIFFKIEYEGFYNGTVIHSKDNGYSDITINDNSSASLTLLEKDGLFQKEKVNRFANEQITITARYNNIDDVQELGTVFEDDIIIYHRELSIFDNMILVTYFGTKDYVLKNYFTTVFAKHRPYNLLPYEESTIRAENKKVFLDFSKTKTLFEKNKVFNFDLSKLLNFFKANTNETAKVSSKVLDKSEAINAAYMQINGEKYASDVNTFVSGDSLCLNMSMYDNVSGGVYIKEKEPDVSLMDVITAKDFTGSVQDWYINVDDNETGFLKNIGFCFSHKENDLYDKALSEEFIKEIFYKQIFEAPKITFSNYEESNLINGEFEINKDNKEIIDMTFQIEPITTEKDVFFSQWMMKLSNLLGVYTKINKEITVNDAIVDSQKIKCLSTTVSYDYNLGSVISQTLRFPFIMFQIPDDVLKNIVKGSNFKLRLFYIENPYGVSLHLPGNIIYQYIIDFKDVTEVGNNSSFIAINVEETITYRKPTDSATESTTEPISRVMYFKQTETFCGHNLNDYISDNYTYFINMDFKYDEDTELTQCVNDSILNSNFITTKDGETSSFTAYSNQVSYAKQMIINGLANAFLYDVYTVPIINYNANNVETTYPKNMFIVLGEEPLKKHLVYDEYEDISNVSGMFLTDYNVNEIISLENVEKEPPYIKVNLSKISDQILKYQSLQMWYFVNGSYKFVFGVNFTEEDINKKEGIKIYVSTISNKDPRVYDTNGMLIGEVKNYCNDLSSYGNEQYYEKK